MRIRVLFGLLSLLVLCAVAGSGCGGSSSKSSGDPKKGRKIFKAQCGTCHTLEDAGTEGTAGPNLDDFGDSLSEDVVANQVKNPTGGMPDDLARGQEIDDVAAYVAQAVG